jgi:hypothetical protein
MVGKRATWLALALGTLGAVALLVPLVWRLNADSPLLDSPVSQYLIAIAISGSFVLGSWSAGIALTRVLLPGRLRWEERLSVGFALGVVAFYAAVFAVGMMGVLRRDVAFGIPLVLFAAGAPDVWRLVRRARWARRQRFSPSAPRSVLLACVGAIPLLFIGGQALTSSAIGYDASWYHLPVAESYAATGAIRPFPEGWMLGAYPQLASILYAWGLVTAKRTALGWTTCAFIEVSLAAAAIFGVVPLLRVLTPGGGRPTGAWAAIALFPAVYLYAPRVEADYTAASFAAPLLLVAFKIWDRVESRLMITGAVLLAGLLLVKYTAVSGSVFPITVVLAALARELWRARREGLLVPKLRELTKAVAGAAAVFVLITATHWLKNLIAYGDPLFPNGSTKPFTPGTLRFYRDVLTTLWQPAPGAAGWWETARALVTFSFEPHEYAWFNAGHPVFGSLFTLSLPALVLLRKRRLLVAYLGTLLGLVVWFRLHHQDRYLLVLLPAMCAITAGAVRALWRAGALPRLFVAAACALQTIWGLRWALQLFPFEAVRGTVACSSVDAWNQAQTARSYPMQRLNKLEPGGKILLHSTRLRLGLRLDSVTDSPGYQTRLSFAELGSDQRVYDALAALGVTRLYAPSYGDGYETIGGELVFRAFFERWGRKTSDPSVRLMPLQRPPSSARARLAFLDACQNAAASGLYRVSELTSFAGAPGAARPVQTLDTTQADDAARLLQQAEFLVVPSGCDSLPLVGVAFSFVAQIAGTRLYMRASPPP